MARQPRIDFPGAFHHVMNRGAARQATYRNQLDRELFLSLWAKAVPRFGIEVLAFTVMGNHYHVFVHSPDGQLSSTMQYIGRAYTQEFNEHHERDGALFRGRFHSVLVDSEIYFARVARYIELNPVNAGLCSLEELSGYRWSSFAYNSDLLDPPPWLATNHLRKRFPRAADYREFVADGSPDTELSKFYSRAFRPGRVLGNGAFVNGIASEYPEFADTLTPGLGSITPDQIELLVSDLTGAPRSELTKATRRSSAARQATIILSHKLTDESRAALAERYGFASDSSFINAVSRIRAGSSVDGLEQIQTAVIRSLDCK